MAALGDRVNVGLGVIVERDGKVLLGKRIHAKHGQGEWSLPGGKPDPRESPQVGAARELEEETGLKVLPNDLNALGLWTYDRYDDYQVHFVTLYFIADVGDQEPVNTEPDKCAGWEWCDPYDLPSPLFSGLARVFAVAF